MTPSAANSAPDTASDLIAASTAIGPGSNREFAKTAATCHRQMRASSEMRRVVTSYSLAMGSSEKTGVELLRLADQRFAADLRQAAIENTRICGLSSPMLRFGTPSR